MVGLKGISAVVATLNSEKNIKRCIESILSNGLNEIVLVDGGSSDRTITIAEKYPAVKIIKNVKGGRPSQKDAGWRVAEGSLILFMDSDTYIDDGTVSALLPYLKDEALAGISCRVACANPQNILARLRDFDFELFYSELFRESRVAEAPADPTGCGLFKRRALEEIDGFDLEYPYAEDLKLLHRLQRKGYRVQMTYTPVVYHHHRENLKGVCEQFYWHGYGRGMLVEETRQKFYLKRNPIKLMSRFLKTATKKDTKLIPLYPIYRAFVEVAFLLGYAHGRTSRRYPR